MSENWDLATGRAGKAHVTSAMEGWKMTGLMGADRRVLKTRNQLKATLVNVNTVTLDTGDLIFDGRHVSCDLSVDVTISNGTQGQKRIDIIAAHYHRDTTTAIETIEPFVFRGEPSGGTPSTPTIPSGLITGGATDAYYPLYRINLDGLTVAQPTALFSKQNSMQDLETLLGSAKEDYAAKINAETAARKTADANLQTNIDNEAAVRKTADANLKDGIDSANLKRAAAVSSLQTSIDNEATTRKSQIDALKTHDYVTSLFCRSDGKLALNNGATYMMLTKQTGGLSISNASDAKGDHITGLEAGTYYVQADLLIEDTVANAWHLLRIEVDGSAKLVGMGRGDSFNSGTGNNSLHASGIVKISKTTDLIRVVASGNKTATMRDNGILAITRI